MSPTPFRKLFLQRMDILDALDEGLLAIDENKCVTYLNRAASEILQIDQSAALGQPLKAVYPRSSIPRVMRPACRNTISVWNPSPMSPSFPIGFPFGTTEKLRGLWRFSATAQR